MRIWTKTAVFAAAFFSLLAGSPSLMMAARLMPLDEAVSLAIKNDPEMADMRKNISKKQMEINQAIQAVRNQEDKDSSLFAKQHSLAKDIELAFKVPAARKEYNFAAVGMRAKEREIRFNTEQIYMKALQSAQQAEESQRKLDKALTDANDIRRKEKFGLAKKEDIEEADKAVEKAASALKLAQLANKASKMDLGGKLALDMDNDLYTFEMRPQYVRMSQSLMWKLASGAEKNDYTLYQDVENRKLADEKVAVTRKLYANKFGGGTTSIIESMYTGTDMDYDVFMGRYDQMLAAIKKQWEGFYWLLFFPIPKFIFQGEYDGLRYFEDVQNSLPVSMLEQDKARLKEKDSRKKLLDKVKASYLNVKSSEETYAQSLKAADKVKTQTEQARRKYETGLSTKDELDQALEAQAQAEKTVQGNYFGYKTALSKLDLDTGGSLGRYYVGGVLPYKQIEDGLEPLGDSPEQPDRIFGSWSVKEVAESMVVDFSIKPDDKLGVTHFELMTADGKLIGEKQPVTGSIRHLGFVFSDPSTLKVVLYKGEDKLEEAALDGYGSKGTLLGPEPQEESNPDQGQGDVQP